MEKISIGFLSLFALINAFMGVTHAHAVANAVVHEPPPCEGAYVNFMQQVQAQQVSEDQRLANGALKELEYSIDRSERIKQRLVSKVIEQELTRQFWSKSLTEEDQSTKKESKFKTEEVIELSAELLYERMHEEGRDLFIEGFSNVFSTRSIFENSLRSEVTNAGFFSEIFLNRTATGIWRTSMTHVSSFLSNYWAFMTIPLSASRIPPEREWAKSVAARPSLLLTPNSMEKLGFLQGESYQAVYCMAYKRHQKIMERATQKLLKNMEHAFQNQVLDLVYPERLDVPPLGLDMLSVRPIYRLLMRPSWAKQ